MFEQLCLNAASRTLCIIHVYKSVVQSDVNRKANSRRRSNISSMSQSRLAVVRLIIDHPLFPTPAVDRGQSLASRSSSCWSFLLLTVKIHQEMARDVWGLSIYSVSCISFLEILLHLFHHSNYPAASNWKDVVVTVTMEWVMGIKINFNLN